MRDDIQVGIIGGGAMAEALIAGLLECGTIPASHISVSDHKAIRCDELTRKYGVHAQVGAESFLPRIDVLILAVKPAAAAAAIRETRELLRADAAVLSIVAGLTIAALEEGYPDHPVVRAMPNTPLAVGAGMSAYACGTYADDGVSAIVELLLGASGRTVRVHESDLDAVTGLSGSGPAYAFLMIEALIEGRAETRDGIAACGTDHAGGGADGTCVSAFARRSEGGGDESRRNDGGGTACA